MSRRWCCGWRLEQARFRHGASHVVRRKGKVLPKYAAISKGNRVLKECPRFQQEAVQGAPKENERLPRVQGGNAHSNVASGQQMVGLGILPQAYEPYPPGNKGLQGIILYFHTNERCKTNGDCSHGPRGLLRRTRF
jgi:hypothetical protein